MVPIARTSKKKNGKPERDGQKKVYSVGIYARLSVDSHGQKNESIETQIDIAKAYMEQQSDLVLYGCYSDLGQTGTNFERKGFQQLMMDVRLRKVDCVIVKDFSRFGRDYIETGNYIQKIFPFLGVRFISVTDQFDSRFGENDELGMNLKNLVNEMYARDIAVKVKTAKRAQWVKGSYTGGIPPYGYRAEWRNGKKCLFREDITSDIVREIFALYDSGKNMREIVIWLYDKKIHRPSDYRRYGHVFWKENAEKENCFGKLREWSRGSVKMILTNPVYTGCLVQAGTCGKRYQMRRKHDIDSEDWAVKEHTHEALVDEELFLRIAMRFEKQAVYSNKNGFSKIVPKSEDIFEGILFCGDCKSRMDRISTVKEVGSGDRVRRYSYVCKHAARMDGQGCGKRYINYDVLTDIVKAVLKQEFLLTGVKPKELVEHNNMNVEKQKQGLEKNCIMIQKNIEQQIRKESEQYIIYKKGEIGRADFQYWKENSSEMIQGLKNRLEEQNRLLRKLDGSAAQQNHFIRTLLKFNEQSELNSEFLKILVEKVEFYPDKRVVITFRFTREDIIQIENGGAIDAQTDKDCNLHEVIERG